MDVKIAPQRLESLAIGLDIVVLLASQLVDGFSISKYPTFLFPANDIVTSMGLPGPSKTFPLLRQPKSQVPFEGPHEIPSPFFISGVCQSS